MRGLLGCHHCPQGLEATTGPSCCFHCAVPTGPPGAPGSQGLSAQALTHLLPQPCWPRTAKHTAAVQHTNTPLLCKPAGSFHRRTPPKAMTSSSPPPLHAEAHTALGSSGQQDPVCPEASPGVTRAHICRSIPLTSCTEPSWAHGSGSGS